MSITVHVRRRRSRRVTFRRGAVAPLVAVSAALLVGMAALAIDSGVMYTARAQLQASADAAALAGAGALLDENRLRSTAVALGGMGSSPGSEMIDAARRQAAAYAARNPVMGANPVVDLNAANAPTGDIVCGYLSNPRDLHEQLALNTTNPCNTVLVRVRRNNVRNGPVGLFFASMFGIRSANIGAEAAASFEPGVVGFHIPSESSAKSSLMPFALKKSAWDQFLSGTLNDGDRYSYTAATDNITNTPDGIYELNIYPGAASGSTQLGPGNFGTLCIGDNNNSTKTLSRQIGEGLNAEDLSYYDGNLELGEDGTLLLQGNTGLSAGMETSLEAAVGQTRILPIFSTFQGTGSGGTFTIVGFVGIRIVHVRLAGSMNQKDLTIQPAFVVDGTVITGPGSDSTSFVYAPARLVR